MRKFSANLGFLWTELTLPEAIHAAANAGFDAVECHWPYEYDPVEVKQALKKAGLQMIGLNTVRGNPGENGLTALPGRELEAKAAIDQAIKYANAIGAKNIHVMAGFSSGQQADQSYVSNLQYACQRASENDMTILIEPLNQKDAPGYFLKNCEHVAEVIARVDIPNLKMMFDCYHIEIIEGEVIQRLTSYFDLIGHIQIASVPDRREPDHGDLDYEQIYSALDELGYDKPIGAEYRPDGDVASGLGWLLKVRS